MHKTFGASDIFHRFLLPDAGREEVSRLAEGRLLVSTA